MTNFETVMCHHEWGTLEEAIVGISPAGDFVIPHWYAGLTFMGPDFKKLSEQYGRQRMIDVKPDWAHSIEAQVDGFADLLVRLGVVVHRPTRLEPLEATYLTPAAEGAQLYPRDPVLVIGEQIIELNIRMPWRRRETFGVRSVVQPIAEQRNVGWVGMPLASLDPLEDQAPEAGSDRKLDHVSPLLEGGDVLLNGYDIYVGQSGLASNTTGVGWLQRHLGPAYRVHPIPIERDALHLDTVMSLIAPGLGLICPTRLIDADKDNWSEALPPGLEDFDWIVVDEDGAELLGCNACVLSDRRIVFPEPTSESDPKGKLTAIIAELQRRDVEVITTPYDKVAALGGALRCSHHPIVRKSALPSG